MLNEMEVLHPGAFWRVLNPEEIPTEDPDNSKFPPYDARFPTVTEDEHDPPKLGFSETFYSINSDRTVKTHVRSQSGKLKRLQIKVYYT